MGDINVVDEAGLSPGFIARELSYNTDVQEELQRRTSVEYMRIIEDGVKNTQFNWVFEQRERFEKRKRSRMQLAATWGFTNMLEELVKIGDTVKEKCSTRQNKQPIHFASEYRHTDIGKRSFSCHKRPWNSAAAEWPQYTNVNYL